MTILVATFDGVWADRRVSGGPSVYSPARKVVRGRGLVAGFCGSSAGALRAMRAVREGETNPDVLALLSDGLLVNDRGRWELSSRVATRVSKRFPFLVHGSGYAEAQAFLMGAGAHDAASVRRAIRYVSTVRADCGDGCDSLLLHV